MKVYFYISIQDLILFNGFLAEPLNYVESGISVNYYEQHAPGTVMVSVDIDTFIYFQDNDLLSLTQLIQN